MTPKHAHSLTTCCPECGKVVLSTQCVAALRKDALMVIWHLACYSIRNRRPSWEMS